VKDWHGQIFFETPIAPAQQAARFEVISSDVCECLDQQWRDTAIP